MGKKLRLKDIETGKVEIIDEDECSRIFTVNDYKKVDYMEDKSSISIYVNIPKIKKYKEIKYNNKCLNFNKDE